MWKQELIARLPKETTEYYYDKGVADCKTLIEQTELVLDEEKIFELLEGYELTVLRNQSQSESRRKRYDLAHKLATCKGLVRLKK